jgi:hypothetical protein
MDSHSIALTLNRGETTSSMYAPLYLHEVTLVAAEIAALFYLETRGD